MPEIEQVPWNYGAGAYYRGLNAPIAVILHRQQGYKSTARQWALSGYTGASWHYTVGLDGSIMKHLSHSDGGFHAGINHEVTGIPTWPLWKGSSPNVNLYTIGVECEGFEGGEWPRDQLASLKWLCERLASELHIPYDREHFPPHADINIRDRVNDFDTPERRHIVYDYLFGEEDMADPRLDAVIAALGGMAEIEAWNAKGNSLLLGYALEQEKLDTHLAAPHGTAVKG
ncbi:MAG: N-acetylmuramoyl-L-alanine amidase, partial [Myxococcales bacterium]|nr:N-acetylmuramoyl-L-alanine amidase [Myxococcales bacterium]